MNARTGKRRQRPKAYTQDEINEINAEFANRMKEPSNQERRGCIRAVAVVAIAYIAGIVTGIVIGTVI